MLQRLEGRTQAESGSCAARFGVALGDRAAALSDSLAPTGPAADNKTLFAVSATATGPHISWLSAAGKLVDEAAAAVLADALERQRALGCRFAWLDLSRVPMLDRAGFDVLVEARHRFLSAGGTLVLTGVSPRIARLLELTGEDKSLLTRPIATTIATPPDPDPDRTGREVRQAEAHDGDAQALSLADGLGGSKELGVRERASIDRAIGMVMGRTHCGAEEAVEQLLVLGHATNRTLREVAESILDAHGRSRTRRITDPRGKR